MANQIANKQTLSEASAGDTWRVVSFIGSGCKQLRKIGFCEALQVKKLSNGRNIICVTCGTKLVLNRRLADQVLVCPV